MEVWGKTDKKSINFQNFFYAIHGVFKFVVQDQTKDLVLSRIITSENLLETDFVVEIEILNIPRLHFHCVNRIPQFL